MQIWKIIKSKYFQSKVLKTDMQKIFYIFNDLFLTGDGLQLKKIDKAEVVSP